MVIIKENQRSYFHGNELFHHLREEVRQEVLEQWESGGARSKGYTVAIGKTFIMQNMVKQRIGWTKAGQSISYFQKQLKKLSFPISEFPVIQNFQFHKKSTFSFQMVPVDLLVQSGQCVCGHWWNLSYAGLSNRIKYGFGRIYILLKRIPFPFHRQTNILIKRTPSNHFFQVRTLIFWAFA